ncbi:hypothetical protein GGF46_004712 [Coemansia sp. RSA 552]|nr:hypothetical protein GGF46_004712 [Coemansia sp. RSA 552]
MHDSDSRRTPQNVPKGRPTQAAFSDGGDLKPPRRRRRGQQKDSPVPRILTRPERAEPASEPPPRQERPAVQSKAAKPVVRPPRAPTAQLTNQWIPVVTATGRILGTALRQQLGSLRVRMCVGVVGRSLSSDVAGRFAESRWISSPGGGNSREGVSLWVTEGRVVFVDPPPVMSQAVADSFCRDAKLPRVRALKTYSLQLVLFLLQICDTLVVVHTAGAQVDKGLAKLLALARELAGSIPGFVAPAGPLAPGMVQAVGKRPGCRLNILVVGPHSRGRGQDGPDIAQGYEAATGISVAGVSYAPGPRSVPESTGDLQFLSVAESWKSSLPLYSIADGGAPKGPASVLPPSIFRAGRAPHQRTFGECVDRMRDRVLAESSLWREEGSEGAWASACVRSWDSVRRSSLLQSKAAAKDPDLDSSSAGSGRQKSSR